MFSKLKNSLWKLAYEQSLKNNTGFHCQACGRNFDPPAEYPGDEKSLIACTHCQHQETVQEWLRLINEPVVQPAGPVLKPDFTKIVLSELPGGDAVWRIPRAGKLGGSTIFGFFWTAFSIFALVTFISGGGLQKNDVPFFAYAILILFPLIGLGLIYAGLLQNFSKRILYIGREKVRLQTDLFGFKKIHDLPTAEISTVTRAVFYTQNYQPVYGIEICANGKKIRFGSALTDSEQQWLCWEIKQKIKGFYPQGNLL